MIHNPPAGVALDRLARLERLYDGPIPAPLRRWALSGMPPAPPRLEADPGATDTQASGAPPGAAPVEARAIPATDDAATAGACRHAVDGQAIADQPVDGHAVDGHSVDGQAVTDWPRASPPDPA